MFYRLVTSIVAAVLSGMLTVFFFAPLWRRAKVLTDMEFAEFRYSGPPATFLRGFRAVYLALPVNTIIMMAAKAARMWAEGGK